MIPRLFATLNLVDVPVTIIELAFVETNPDIVCAMVDSTVNVKSTGRERYPKRSAKRY